MAYASKNIGLHMYSPIKELCDWHMILEQSGRSPWGNSYTGKQPLDEKFRYPGNLTVNQYKMTKVKYNNILENKKKKKKKKKKKY